MHTHPILLRPALKQFLQRVMAFCLFLSLLLSAAGCGGQSATPPASPPASQETSADQPASPDQAVVLEEPAQPGTPGSAEALTPGELPLPAPTATPEPLPDEQLTIRGQVILPAESGLVLEDLALLTNLSTVPLDSSGAFSAEIARNMAYPSLVILVNAAGNPVLLATRRGEAVNQPWEISLESTARALVFFDPAVWSLTLQQQDQLEAAFPEHSFSSYLSEILLSTLQADPQDPLNSELHPDPYDIAALITAELLRSQAESAEGSLPGRSKALFSPAYRPLAKANEFVWVEDDINHNQPEVTLVNNTFCYYTATVSAGPEGSAPAVWENTQADPLVLDKSKLYSVRFMPTAESNMGTERVISPGDGNLRFVFKLDDRRTIYDLGWSIIGAIIGGMGANVAQNDKVVYGLLKEGVEAVYGDLFLLISSSKGKSAEDLAGEVAGWFAKNSLKVLSMYAEAMSAEWKEKANSEFLKKAGTLVGSKSFFLAQAGYTGSDILATAYSLANSPREITEQGLQRAGRYPSFRLSALPEVIRLPDLSNLTLLTAPQGAAQATALATVTLVVLVEDVPEDMTSFQIYLDYQDGTPPKSIPVSAEYGRVSIEDIHTFIAPSPAVKIEVLDYMTSQPIAGITVPVLIGAAATTKIFTLRFEYEPGACLNSTCNSDWNGCSRLNTNLPVRLIGNDKLVIAYAFENFEKHMSVFGTGSLKGNLLHLSFTADWAVDKTCLVGDSWEPCQLRENAEVTVSGPFDPSLEYEQALLASGFSNVNWPRTEPTPSPDNSLQCTATVVKAFIYPGYKDYGR